MVQLGGLEPPTSWSTAKRSNQLSYSCTRRKKRAQPHKPKGRVGVLARGLDQLEAKLGEALGGGTIGVLERVGGLLGYRPYLLVGLFRLSDAFLGNVTQCGRNFHFVRLRRFDLRRSRTGGG